MPGGSPVSPSWLFLGIFLRPLPVLHSLGKESSSPPQTYILPRLLSPLPSGYWLLRNPVLLQREGFLVEENWGVILDIFLRGWGVRLDLKTYVLSNFFCFLRGQKFHPTKIPIRWPNWKPLQNWQNCSNFCYANWWSKIHWQYCIDLDFFKLNWFFGTLNLWCVTLATTWMHSCLHWSNLTVFSNLLARCLAWQDCSTILCELHL